MNLLIKDLNDEFGKMIQLLLKLIPITRKDKCFNITGDIERNIFNDISALPEECKNLYPKLFNLLTLFDIPGQMTKDVIRLM